MKKILLGIVLLAIAGVALYWWLGKPSAEPEVATSASLTPTATAPSSQYVAGNLLLGADSNATLGRYLIGYNAMTLYTYSKDTPGQTNCTGQCAVNWPPYTVATPDVLANVQAGITGSVDTIPRDDGSLQVTYNGMPLYFYVKDKVSGDTTGQNVGGVWFVVKP